MSALPSRLHSEGFCVDFKNCDQRPACEDEIEFCRAWIRENVVPTPGIRRRHSSYAFKHFVENSSRGDVARYDLVDPCGRPWSSTYRYVSNGSFIVAAIREGYIYEAIGGSSPNVFFNMKPKPAPPRIRAARVVLLPSNVIPFRRPQ